jgi:hypothetical protein
MATTGRRNIINHITYATEWDHVNVAFIAQANIDGEQFDKPTERVLNSPAVMNAMKALQNVVEKALADDYGANVEITTSRAMRDARIRAEEQARAELIAGKKAAIEERRPRAAKKSGAKKARSTRGARKTT